MYYASGTHIHSFPDHGILITAPLSDQGHQVSHNYNVKIAIYLIGTTPAIYIYIMYKHTQSTHNILFFVSISIHDLNYFWTDLDQVYSTSIALSIASYKCLKVQVLVHNEQERRWDIVCNVTRDGIPTIWLNCTCNGPPGSGAFLRVRKLHYFKPYSWRWRTAFTLVYLRPCLMAAVKGGLWEPGLIQISGKIGHEIYSPQSVLL